jgi:Family of unknown function (DUF6152)
MKRQTAAILGACALALGVFGAASAHHSFAQFDRDTEKLISGEVVRWAFNNPHTWLYMNVENEDGTTTLWGFEGSGPINLLRRGINGATFEPGDRLTLMYCPLRDGRPGGHMGWARLADGRFIDPSDGGCFGDEETIKKWQGWLELGITSSAEVASE